LRIDFRQRVETGDSRADGAGVLVACSARACGGRPASAKRIERTPAAILITSLPATEAATEGERRARMLRLDGEATRVSAFAVVASAPCRTRTPCAAILSLAEARSRSTEIERGS